MVPPRLVSFVGPGYLRRNFAKQPPVILEPHRDEPHPRRGEKYEALDERGWTQLQATSHPSDLILDGPRVAVAAHH